MTSVVKCIGNNEYFQFGTSLAFETEKLVDAGINTRSQKITQILSCDDFVIYCEDGYANIYTSGMNSDGRFEHTHHLITYLINQNDNYTDVRRIILSALQTLNLMDFIM